MCEEREKKSGSKIMSNGNHACFWVEIEMKRKVAEREREREREIMELS